MDHDAGTETQIGDLLERLRLGQTAARDDLIRHACHRLQVIAHRMLRGYPHLRRWEGTDDVFQNAALRLHRALADVTPDSPSGFFNLAAAQIRRELIDLARRHFGPHGLGANYATDGVSPNQSGDRPRHEPPDGTNNPSTLVEWADFHEKVDGLSGPEREVFEMRWYEGMQVMDIAAVLGVSEKTVSRRWREACRLLFRAMHGAAPGG